MVFRHKSPAKKKTPTGRYWHLQVGVISPTSLGRFIWRVNSITHAGSPRSGG